MGLKQARRAAVVVALMIGGCGRPAQMGADPEVFKAVDALYTAVSLREPRLVGSCLERLKGSRDAGKLPVAAFSALEAIVAEAEGGGWEDAQLRLSRFMRGQSRGR